MTFVIEDELPSIAPTWAREVWLLDPGPFIDIAFDLGVTDFVFRAKYHEAPGVRQDFTKYISIYSRGRPWRCIWIPYPGDFAVLFTHDLGWKHPAAAWPIWRATTNTLDQLRELFETELRPGHTMGHFGVFSREEESDLIPVEVQIGQEHRVLVANMPRIDNQWGEIAAFAQQVQMTDPDRTFHFHGQKSVGRTIGIGAKSFDHPVRIGWNGAFPWVLLPNGMIWQTDSVPGPVIRQWLRVIGYTPRDFELRDQKALSRRVYEANLKALRWAFLNWDRAWDFRRAADADDPDIGAPEMDWHPKSLPVRLRKTKHEDSELDRWLCNTCTLQFKCPYSREGAVCIVPDSEPAQLAEAFGTRSAVRITETLGVILQAQGNRIQAAMREEEAEREADKEEGKVKVHMNPNITRGLNTLFDRGVQLLKLLDPKVAERMSGGKLQVNILSLMGNPQNGSAPAITSQALMAAIAGELEARGISLEDASDEVIKQILTEIGTEAPEPLPIEAHSRET